MSEFELLLPMPEPEGLTKERLRILEKLARISCGAFSDMMESGSIPRKHEHNAAVIFGLAGEYQSLTGESLQ